MERLAAWVSSADGACKGGGPVEHGALYLSVGGCGGGPVAARGGAAGAAVVRRGEDLPQQRDIPRACGAIGLTG